VSNPGNGVRRVSDGSVLLVAHSDLFDLRYYSAVAKREFGSVRDAALDYCERGWRAGLNPSRAFDTKYYLRIYDDVRSAGLNPLNITSSMVRPRGDCPEWARDCCPSHRARLTTVSGRVWRPSVIATCLRTFRSMSSCQYTGATTIRWLASFRVDGSFGDGVRAYGRQRLQSRARAL
jgi:hypothetical protein